MKKILVNLIVLSSVGSVAFGLTSSFFSDTEVSAENNLTAGRLDLKINGGDNTPNIVNLTDLKPGDNQIVEKTLFVDFNPAKVWMHLKDVTATQGAQTEPEFLEEGNNPIYDLKDFITYDLTVENNIIISQADNIKIKDAESCWIPLGELPGNVNVKVYQSFHLPSDVTNWAQGDQLNFTEEFLAQQKNDPTIPVTGSGRVWNPDLKKCVDTEITCVPTYANVIVSNSQGKRKDGSNILVTRTNPDTAREPQTVGAPYDNPVSEGTFYSLGFPYGNTPAGTITLQFTNPFVNQDGPDLKLFEVTGGTSYPDEKVSVEISPDNLTYTPLGVFSRDAEIEMGIPEARFVRLTEASNINSFESTADGYDLDGVQAFCGTN